MIRIVNESKQDWERLYQSFIKKYTGSYSAEPEECAKALLDKYKSLRHLITDPEYNDITRLAKNNISPDELSTYLNNLDSKTQERKFLKKFGGSAKRDFDSVKDNMPFYRCNQKTYRSWTDKSKAELYGALDSLGVTFNKQEFIDEGSKLVYEGDGWKVYKITNWAAAEYFGRDSGWCISGNYDAPADTYFREQYYFYMKGKWLFCLEYNEEHPELSIVWDGTDGADTPYGMPLWYQLPRDFPQIKKTFPKWISEKECIKIFKKYHKQFYGLNDVLDDRLDMFLGKYVEVINDDEELKEIIGLNAKRFCRWGRWTQYITDSYNGRFNPFIKHGDSCSFEISDSGEIYCVKLNWRNPRESLVCKYTEKGYVPYCLPLWCRLPSDFPVTYEGGAQHLTKDECRDIFMKNPTKFYGKSPETDRMLDEEFGELK